MNKIMLLAVWAVLYGCAGNTIHNAEGKIENVIVITTDGLRWQELYKGMDSLIAANGRFNQGRGDSARIFENYWAANETERRKKLLPFFWDSIAQKGQLYGNRAYGNKVDVANPYWFSYPGYNEIFTGYPDTAINSNEYKPNPHTTVLEYINRQGGFKGRVAAYGAWGAFDRILNKERCGFPVVSAFSSAGGGHPTPKEELINAMLKNSYKPFGEGECLDVFTHYAATEYLKEKKPRVLFIGYGETDEWAHAGRYKDYLDAARQVDTWIKEIWEYVQRTPEYRNKTALFITTDHGRGDINKDQWTGHGSGGVADSHEMWIAVMGPGIPAKGEVKTVMQLYQKQSAQTIASLLELRYQADHPIAEEIKEMKD
ncbi:alkaline phosphatase family protein [Agriterribacter sp.]|uniref:alkaline phosphatase family protein n=1 Tax=Agriterribacter sp. TaxID=2821509 RepID=UPI002BB0D0BF|nr:alkaline phosphatase family protein [Agriterribacter sp.]HTN07436.1 alkaline phosphatase family protein [Agriterribacter sp.]